MSTYDFKYLYGLCASLEAVSKELDRYTTDLATTADHVALIRHFDQVSQSYDVLSEVKKLLNATYDRLSRDLIPEAMAKAGVKTTTVEGVGRVSVSHRFSATMIDKEAGYNWLRDNQHGDLITETVNSSSLSAFAKNLLQDEGKELPEEIFKVGTSPYTSITKAK